MIDGVHTILFSPDADRLREFFRDVIGLDSVDAGEGWLIFGTPPGELAIHPLMGEGESPRHEMYLMCDDIEATVDELQGRGATCGDIQDFPFGRLVALSLPDGTEMGLYEPLHPTATHLG